MGGPLVVRTAAALPNRIGAGGSFHGGGLVTDKPDSPHLLASKIKARMYFGIAVNDDMRQPDAKDKLKETFAAAKVPTEIEVYSGAQHGWCVSDMPKQNNGEPIYSKADAERAWAKLVAFTKRASRKPLRGGCHARLVLPFTALALLLSAPRAAVSDPGPSACVQLRPILPLVGRF
jgi:carboxymethylenebutenolidase